MLAELGGQHGGLVESELNVVRIRRRGIVGQIPRLVGRHGDRVGSIEFPGRFRVCGEVRPRRESREHLLQKVVMGRGIEVGIGKLNLRRVRDLGVMLMLLLLLMLMMMMMMMTILEVLKRDLRRV